MILVQHLVQHQAPASIWPCMRAPLGRGMQCRLTTTVVTSTSCRKPPRQDEGPANRAVGAGPELESCRTLTYLPDTAVYGAVMAPGSSTKASYF